MDRNAKIDKIGLDALSERFAVGNNFTPIPANTLHIDTTNANLLDDKDVVNRIKRAFDNFKTMTVHGANITINDEDPENITIIIKGNEIKINN